MAVGWKATGANSMLDAALRAVPFTGPAAIFVQLHSGGEPGAAGTSNVALGNPTRHAVTFGAASGGVSTNSTSVVWTSGEVTAATDYVYFSLWSASSAGTFVGSGTITANAVSIGDTFTIAIGALTVTQIVAA